MAHPRGFLALGVDFSGLFKIEGKIGPGHHRHLGLLVVSIDKDVPVLQVLDHVVYDARRLEGLDLLQELQALPVLLS